MFSEKLKLLRDENSLSQNELATKLGLSRPTITKYERDERQPDFETLGKIANYFDVSIDWLLGRSEVRRPDAKPIYHLMLDDKFNEIPDLTEEELEYLAEHIDIAFDYIKRKRAKEKTTE